MPTNYATTSSVLLAFVAVLSLDAAVVGGSHGSPRRLQTWWHNSSEQQARRPTAPHAVRQSINYGVKISLNEGQDMQWEESFVYMSIPRSGAAKRGYATVDGAEYAAGAGLTMSWTSFLYAGDVWVSMQVLEEVSDDGRGGAIDNVTLRPLRVAASLETKILDDGTTGILIPYRQGGFKISVEFEEGLFDTYNDGTGCCNLTDKKGPGHSFVHRQPRHSLMIFAEPMLTADELQYLDPEYDPRINTSDAIAYAPKGDVSTFLENVKNTTKEVLYFRPG
eukprot:gene24534-31915_t